MAYSREKKELVVRMMLPPNNKKNSDIYHATGIPVSTIQKWRSELRGNGHAAPGMTSSEQWSSRDKFLIVVETLPMNQEELSEYCRKKGLYPEQVHQWQEVCEEANAGMAINLAECSKREKVLEKELKQVRKDLSYKEKALAEAAALLVLSKKANAIWGKQDGEQ